MIDVEAYMYWSANNDMSDETCWTFISKVSLEVFGIRLPTLKNQKSIFALEKEVLKQQELTGNWEEVTDPRCGDVILLLLGGRRPHVGIMVDANSFLHFSESDKMVKRDSPQALNWRNRIDGFYRHHTCCT